jgi:hypothetical protein
MEIMYLHGPQSFYIDQTEVREFESNIDIYLAILLDPRFQHTQKNATRQGSRLAYKGDSVEAGTQTTNCPIDVSQTHKRGKNWIGETP